MRRYLVILVLAPAAGAARAGEAAPPAAAGGLILDEGSWWRSFLTWRTPVVRRGEALEEGKASGHEGGDFTVDTPAPPAGWVQPDFSDSSWSRFRIPRKRPVERDYGFSTRGGSLGPALALQCLRGKFTVTNPARARLSLSLAYRGGAVVCVNGKEVARGHLPKEGEIAPETLAEDYPPEAFVAPEKDKRKNTYCILAEFGHPKKYRDLVEKRIRRLENVAIPPSALRKGTNVLALEFHRAPYFGNGLKKEGMNHRSVWSTCGLVSLKLTAAGGVAPNLSRPRGLAVWNCSAMRNSYATDFPDPHEKLEPIRIVGCRNGRFDGKVIVGSKAGLRGVKATASDLVHKGGRGKIPASEVKLLYTLLDEKKRLSYRYGIPEGGFWDTLSETPPAEVQPVRVGRRGEKTVGAIQPIVVKVSVPPEATPGDYRGKLTINAAGRKLAEVPVKLRVIDWKLPDPKDFATHMGVIQSPESLAMEYEVPLWGEKHWKLVEESFKLLGEIGNKYVVLPLICRTNFGNAESMVRWIKQPGGGYKHDFTVFDKYLDLALKHTKPDVICLYVWDLYAGSIPRHYTREAKAVKVTLFDPKTGKSEEMEGPRYDRPEAKAFWAPVYKGVRGRLERRGVLPVAMLGTSMEAIPIPEAANLFKELFPGAKWVASPHGDCRGGKVGGIPIGYNTEVYNNFFPPPGQARKRRSKDGYYYGWKYEHKTDKFPRSSGAITGGNPLYPTARLALHRIFCEACLMGNDSGLGRIGADFWPVLDKQFKSSREAKEKGLSRCKRSLSISSRYPESSWNQRDIDTATEAVLAPGPEGPVPTERFEQIREGLQDCEARIFMEKAILAGKLDADMVKKCREVLDERNWMIRGACTGHGEGFTWYAGAGERLRERLFSCAAEVADKLGVSK